MPLLACLMPTLKPIYNKNLYKKLQKKASRTIGTPLSLFINIIYFLFRNLQQTARYLNLSMDVLIIQ